jgi:hexosaminidase
VRRLRPLLLCAVILAPAALGTPAGAEAPPPRAGSPAPRPLGQVIPAPASVRPGGGPYTLGPGTVIRLTGASRTASSAAPASHASPALWRVGRQLAALLRPSTGYRLPLTARPGQDGVLLRLLPTGHGTSHGQGAGGGHGTSLGPEGYRLQVTRRAVVLSAYTGAGLFHGVQTLRQLLPARVESRTARPGPWRVAGGTITDRPRYSYRGAMLDVSRHFFTVAQVERYIDQLALYKINKLHLHLSDDQGWRIAVNSWPRLAAYGGSTQVGGGPGGYYTKDDYSEIVRYAAARQLTVVPEIDMPGHTNAALASYAELNCDGTAPPPYTGVAVGFSSMCVPREVTYDFVDDVVRELAAMTPGPYLHIGGDEAKSTSHDDYAAFMKRAQRIVNTYGKTVVGWHQLAGARPVKGAVAQYWGTKGDEPEVVGAAKKGTRLVLSPADHAYLDMKYDKDTPLGQDWAGYVGVRQSYDWDPGRYIKGAPARSVLGLEAPLWSETLRKSRDIEYMAFPRLPGIAELGWAPAAAHDWSAYRKRLAQQAPRWDQLGIHYWRHGHPVT